MLNETQINKMERFAGEIRIETFKAISHVPEIGRAHV